MNALTAIIIDPVESAILAANDWVRVATPIIKGYLALDNLESELLISASEVRGHKRFNEPKEYDERVCDDARDEVKGAREKLYGLVEGIREDCICDHIINAPTNPEPTEAAARARWNDAWEQSEEFNDRLRRETISLDAAVRQIGGF